MRYWKGAWVVLWLVLVACNATLRTTEDSSQEDALKAGDIDPNFGSSGRSSTVFGSQTPDPATNNLERSQVEILRISGNRRMVSLGSNGLDGWALMTRHTQGGSLDTGFAQQGKLRVAANLKPVGLEFYCPAMKQSSDCDAPSRMVVAGTQTSNNQSRVWLGAFSEKGLAEAAFGQNGVVTTAVFDQAQARQLAIQPDGKIVVLADASRVGYQARVLLRFLPDGKPDEAFGNKGVLTVSDSNTDPLIQNMLLQDSGFLLLGSSRSQKGWLYSIRYKLDGTPDLGYGQNAVASVLVGEVVDGLREAMVVDGAVMYWGSSAAVQLGSKGELDPKFGDKGVLRFASTEGSARVQQVVSLPSGYLYTIAAPPNHQTTTEIEVRRYFSDGVLDDTFGKDGTKNLTLIGDGRLGVYFEPVVASIARYGNRVIVGGRTVDYSSSDRRAIFTLTRLR